MQYMQLMTHLSVVLAVVGGAFVPNAQAAAPARVEAELRELDAGWESAVAAKDLVKILSFYADDASGLYNGRPIVTGKAAMKDEWQRILARSNLNLHWAPTRIEVAKSADMAYDIGTIKSSTTDPKGNIVNYVGKYVVVWRKAADGQWKVAVDISNSDR